METVAIISWIIAGSDMRATPPWARISAGTRSRAMTAQAPASSAIRAWNDKSIRICQLRNDVVIFLYLLSVDNIHYNATLQHLSETGFDVEVGGTRVAMPF